MEISRQNYEQYFVDYLDGKLSEKQVGILISFLEFNADLKEEFADIEKMCLAPDEIQFSGKAKLLKSESDLVEENILKDFDMYCISSMERDIADEDEEMPMDTVIEIYVKWYEKNYPGTSKECQRIAKEQLENSKIQKFIKKTRGIIFYIKNTCSLNQCIQF